MAVFNLATVVGQVLIGYYCDIGPYTVVMIGTGAVSAVLAYALWGLAHSLALVYVFAVMFGGIVRNFFFENTYSTPSPFSEWWF